jgi:hypothetical protein
MRSMSGFSRGGVEIRNHLATRGRHLGRRPLAIPQCHCLANVTLLRNALLALLPQHFGQALLKIQKDLHSNPAACRRVIRSR